VPAARSACGCRRDTDGDTKRKRRRGAGGRYSVPRTLAERILVFPVMVREPFVRAVDACVLDLHLRTPEEPPFSAEHQAPPTSSTEGVPGRDWRVWCATVRPTVRRMGLIAPERTLAFFQVGKAPRRSYAAASRCSIPYLSATSANLLDIPGAIDLGARRRPSGADSDPSRYSGRRSLPRPNATLRVEMPLASAPEIETAPSRGVSTP
jgi:hypothetical protein